MTDTTTDDAALVYLDRLTALGLLTQVDVYRWHLTPNTTVAPYRVMQFAHTIAAVARDPRYRIYSLNQYEFGIVRSETAP